MQSPCGAMSLPLLKGDVSLTATHHVFKNSDLCRCVFLLATHSLLLWSSCLNDVSIFYCIHTMYSHFWTSSRILNPQLLTEVWFYSFMYVITICRVTHLKKHARNSHAHTWGLGLWVAPCTAAPVAGCSGHLTKLLFCHTYSKVCPHNHKFSSFILLFNQISFSISIIVISWLLFNWDESHLKQT